MEEFRAAVKAENEERKKLRADIKKVREMVREHRRSGEK